MSTRFEAANSEYATRAAITTAEFITSGGYVYIHSLPGSGSYAPIVTVYSPSGFRGFTLELDDAGHLTIYEYNGGTRSTGSATLSTGTWYYIWFRLSDSGSLVDATAYIDESTTADVSEIGATGATDAKTLEFATQRSGYDANLYGDLSLAGWKAWAKDKAASAAATEAAAYALSDTTDAIGAWHFDGTDVSDSHTTGNDLSAGGTLSAGPDSPLDTGSGTTLTASLSAPAATLSAQTEVAVEATASLSAPKATLSAATAVAVDLDASLTAPTATLSAAAQVLVSGTATLAAPAPTLSAEYVSTIEATASLAAPAATLSAAVGVLVETTATLAAPAPTLSSSIHTLEGRVYTATLAAPAPTLSAETRVRIGLSSSLTAPAATLSAGTISTIVAWATLTAPAATLSAQAEVALVLTATLAAPTPSLAAVLGTMLTAIDPPFSASWTDPARSASWTDPARSASLTDPARTASWS